MTGTYPPASGAIAAPRPKRPPLDRNTRAGAAIAGAVSFTLLNIGFVLFWVPILLGFIALIFTTIVRFVARIDPDPDADLRQFARVVDFLNLEAWALPLVVVSVVGLAIMVLAVFSAKWTLSRRGIDRPWAITWAGLGVAVVANSVVGGILSGGFNVVGSLGQAFGGGTEAAYPDGGGAYGAALPAVVVAGVLATLVSIVATAAIGWLSMWWMAHVFRPAAHGAMSPDAARHESPTDAARHPLPPDGASRPAPGETASGI